MSWSAALEYKSLAVPGSSVTSAPLALSGTAFAAGDFVVVMWEGHHAAGSPTSATITDDSSGGPNTWAADAFLTVANDRAVAIWSTTIAHGGSSMTFTVTPNSGCSNNIIVFHYATPGGTVSLDAAATARDSGSTAIATGTLTITGTDLVVCLGASTNTDITAAGTGFTLRSHLTAGDSFCSGEDKLNVTTNLAPGFPAVDTDWSAASAAYKFSAGAPATTGGAALMMGL